MSKTEFPIPDIQQRKPDLVFGRLTKELDGSYAIEAMFQGSAARRRIRLRYFAGLKRMVEGKEGQWVAGSINDKGKLTLLEQSSQEPVQVIPWSSIDKGDNEDSDSAAAFFLNPANAAVPIKCNLDLFPLIGGLNNPGHIIVYDDSGSGAFLKGFSHIGEGQIQRSEVKVLLKEVFRKIANDLYEKNLIKVFPMVFDASHKFLLLATSKSKGKKSKKNLLLDRAEWKSVDKLLYPSDNGDANDGQDALSTIDSGQKAESNAQVSEDGAMQQEGDNQGAGNNNDGGAMRDDNQDNGSDELGRGMWQPLDKVQVHRSAEEEKPYPDNPNITDGQKISANGDNAAAGLTQEANDPGRDQAPECAAEEALIKNQGLPVDDLGGNTNPSDTKTPEEREQEFLKHFKEYVKECGFNYNDRDLERFHTCVKTGMMTLLGGDPGSGKSSLFELYARALAGKSRGCNFKRIDVNPTWMEPSDLMGYSTPNLNNSNGEKQFHESQCGLRSFLADLKGADERAPALVCFEEMNLARIELYFAEFIQLISRYELTSTKKNLPSYGGDDKQAPLIIPSDVRFVGTCNDDPTVKPMSDRFLDRSNVIRLSGNNKAWTDEKEELHLFARGRGKVAPYPGHGVSAEEYKSWIIDDVDQTQGDANQSRKEINSLGNILDGILSKIRAKLSAIVPCPSPRVVGEILRYVANRPFPSGVKDDNVRLYVAFDEALVQRVISKCVPNALMRGKFEAAAKLVEETFEEEFVPGKEKERKPEEGGGPIEKISSLTAERLNELEMETKSLFQWSGVEDDSSVDNAE